MHQSPSCAQLDNDNNECPRDPPDVGQAEAEAFSQLWRAAGAVQQEDRLTARAFHMNVRGRMIIRIDDDTQAIEPMNCRHLLSLP